MKFRTLAVTFPLILLSVLSHCALSQTTKPIEWGAESHGCKVAILNFPSVVKAGEPVDVEVCVRHSGPQAAYLTDIGSRPDAIFDVNATYNDGTKVAHTAYANERDYILNAVRRGYMHDPQEIRRTVRVNRMIDMSSDGDYLVTVAFNFSIDVDGKVADAQAKSPAFKIQVATPVHIK